MAIIEMVVVGIELAAIGLTRIISRVKGVVMEAVKTCASWNGKRVKQRAWQELQEQQEQGRTASSPRQ